MRPTRNFFLLIQRVVKIVNDANEDLRRAYTSYSQVKRTPERGPVRQSTEEIFESMRDTARASQNLTVEVAETRGRLRQLATQVEEVHSEMQINSFVAYRGRVAHCSTSPENQQRTD